MKELKCSTIHFNNIKNGVKKYEGRLNKPDYSDLKIGQKLIIKKSENISEFVEVVVTSIDIYNTFQEMIQDKGLENVLPNEETVESGVNVYRKWYTEMDEQQFRVLCIGVSVSQIHFLLVKMYETFNKLYPGRILEDRYIESFQSNEEDFGSLSDLFLELANFVQIRNLDYPYFVFRYYDGDLSFLDEYNDNVKKFFITLINDNNYINNVFYEEVDLYFSFLTSIDDLIEIMDCLYKNDFLFPKQCSIDYFLDNCSNKLELISKKYNQESKLVKLNFVFSNSEQRHEINSLFLTDECFSENLDEYTFNFGFEIEEGFCEKIINYLITGKRLSDDTLKKLFPRKNMDLIISEDSYFHRRIYDFEDLKYVKIRGKYVVFTPDLYFLGLIRNLDKSELGKYFEENGNSIQYEYDEIKQILKNVDLKYSKNKLEEYLSQI